MGGGDRGGVGASRWGGCKLELEPDVGSRLPAGVVRKTTIVWM